MNYFPLIDTRMSCQFIHDQVKKTNTKKISFVEKIQQADAILVGGGDGYMLQSMRTYHDQNLPFIGYNCGTLWFLLNNITSIQQLPSDSRDLIFITSKLNDVTARFNDGSTQQDFFINDLIIGNHIKDYFHFDIQTAEQNFNITGTWLVVSTSIWSTAYALNLWAPLIPLSSELLSIVWIASKPFNYHFTPSKTIKIQAQGRAVVQASCDGEGKTFENIHSLTIQASEKYVTIWFLPSEDFNTRRIHLANTKLQKT